METNKSSGEARGAIRAQAANIHPRIDKAVPVVTDETTAELAGGDDGVTDSGYCGQLHECSWRHGYTGSASDGYDSGVDDVSDADSDIEERRVDSLINKYL